MKHHFLILFFALLAGCSISREGIRFGAEPPVVQGRDDVQGNPSDSGLPPTGGPESGERPAGPGQGGR